MNTINTVKTPEEQLVGYRNAIEHALGVYNDEQPEGNLYAPIRYLMSIGGKRLRPSMVLAAADAFGGTVEKALPAALAVEVFHNFTLMHDDIMDNAPLRRGQQTVHEKWDANTAILSGDAMFVQAYQQLSKMDAALIPPMLELFNKTAIEVCEGQQYDMDFEQRSDVTIAEYLEMIRLKTSVLLAAAMQMGAMSAGANEEDQRRVYDMGIHIGLAFQLQDDYLDAFGDPEKFGKQVGGDILADKKTFLYIRCLEKANSEQRKALDAWVGKTDDPAGKVDAVRALFLETGVDQDLRAEMERHYAAAIADLEALEISDAGEAVIRYVAQMVKQRTV